MWGFGEPHVSGGSGPANALSTALNTTATQQLAHVRSLFLAYPWWTLEPKTDASVVTTGLGSGTYGPDLVAREQRRIRLSETLPGTLPLLGKQECWK